MKIITLFRKYFFFVLLVPASFSFLGMLWRSQNEETKTNKYSSLCRECSDNKIQSAEKANEDEEELGTNCGGVERWSIKVFTDANASKINWTPKPTTIAHLVSLPVPTWNYTMPRQALEDSTWTITCKVTKKLAEADSDSHLVLSDGVHTMIGEIPQPICNSVAASPKIAQITAAHNWVIQNIGYGNKNNLSLPLVTITGVGFLDTAHGQTGAAPNQLELHSIIDIYFASQTQVQEFESSKIVIGPNPSSGEFGIFNLSDINYELDLYNLKGEKVFSAQTLRSNNYFIRQNFSPGVYLLRLSSERGIISRKIIIGK